MVRPDRRQAVAVDALDLAELAEGLDRERARRAGQAAGRQDVVGAGRVVAGRFGRPRADEHRARVADAGDRRLERLDVDRQVFGGVGVDERDRGVERRRDDDPAVVAQGGREDVAAGGLGELVDDGRFDRVGEGCVRGDEDRRGVRAVLGLGDEVGRDTDRVRGRRGEDHALRRPGREVDADLAADLELGRGHPGVARTDDAIDGFDGGVRETVGEGSDRLGAAGDDERVDSEEPGCAEKDRVEGSVAAGRRGDDDAIDARDLRRDDGHDQRRRVGRRAARDVGADRVDGGPAALDLDAGGDLGRGRGRALGLGEAADVVDRLVEGSADVRFEGVARRFEVAGVEDEPTVRPSATDGGIGVADGVVAAGADVGEGRADGFADCGSGAAPRRMSASWSRRAAGSPAATAARSSRVSVRVGMVAVTGRSSRWAGRGCPRRLRP